MSKEAVEKIATIENVTKKQVIDAVKANKREFDLSEQITTPSIQNIIKDYTSEIIEKIDSKIPTYVQLYSDLYKKYLHIASNFYTSSFLAQKEFFEKIGVDDVRLAMFDTYLESVKRMILLQIDMSENMIQSYVGHRLTALDFYDQVMNGGMINFANICPILNSFKK